MLILTNVKEFIMEESLKQMFNDAVYSVDIDPTNRNDRFNMDVVALATIYLSLRGAY